MTFYNPLLLLTMLSTTLVGWLLTIPFGLFGEASLWVGLAFLLSGAHYARLCGKCAPLSHHDEDVISRLLLIATTLAGVAGFVFMLRFGEAPAAFFIGTVVMIAGYLALVSVYLETAETQVSQVRSR